MTRRVRVFNGDKLNGDKLDRFPRMFRFSIAVRSHPTITGYQVGESMRMANPNGYSEGVRPADLVDSSVPSSGGRMSRYRNRIPNPSRRRRMPSRERWHDDDGSVAVKKPRIDRYGCSCPMESFMQSESRCKYRSQPPCSRTCRHSMCQTLCLPCNMCYGSTGDRPRLGGNCMDVCVMTFFWSEDNYGQLPSMVDATYLESWAIRSA